VSRFHAEKPGEIERTDGKPSRGGWAIAMSPEQRQPLQDTFLRHVREHKVPVTVFLTNGVRLQGHVGAFDAYSVLLVRDRQAQLVYKHAIATILPSEPVRTGRTDEPEPSLA
jgi:host factor-I protein